MCFWWCATETNESSGGLDWSERRGTGPITLNADRVCVCVCFDVFTPGLGQARSLALFRAMKIGIRPYFYFG